MGHNTKLKFFNLGKERVGKCWLGKEKQKEGEVIKVHYTQMYEIVKEQSLQSFVTNNMGRFMHLHDTKQDNLNLCTYMLVSNGLL